MDRRRAGMALVAFAMVVAATHPPRLHADLDVHLSPLSGSVHRVELGIAGLSVMIAVTADAVHR